MNQDFRDLLRALLDHDVRFLVVGAYALAVHGHPRATGDIDVWVDATPDNAARVYRALQAFGAPLMDLSEADLATPGVVFQMGLPPRRIDILTRLSGIDFDAAWRARTESRFGDVVVPVIGFDHLITNKRATGRPKDVVDADELELCRTK